MGGRLFFDLGDQVPRCLGLRPLGRRVSVRGTLALILFLPDGRHLGKQLIQAGCHLCARFTRLERPHREEAHGGFIHAAQQHTGEPTPVFDRTERQEQVLGHQQHCRGVPDPRLHPLCYAAGELDPDPLSHHHERV